MGNHRRAIKQAESLKHKVQLWAARIGVEPKRVQIQRMTAKWASCSTSGRICFSKDILGQSAPFREVVIVHELLHLRVPNHGRLFKSLMNAYLPEWEEKAGGRVSSLCGYQRLNGRER